ncbi:MAG: hypothetical protein QOE40_3008 [Actinomycetota bacterium]|nr:hypothetical protein [Actinomycetota bacterium]
MLFIGQSTLIQLSDPLGTGADWLGTANLVVDGTFGGAALVALIQVTAIVVGHVLAVAHDRAVRLLPHRHAVVGQLPMLLLMVGYTVGGLALLFAG